ncbi:hypothetical protein K438DRAFT_2000480 [Mycena galopus ATCC 62051]|nr:hypothetical protein K438DRAFT_2000480 [Mycena galopus ATCC 62051]
MLLNISGTPSLGSTYTVNNTPSIRSLALQQPAFHTAPVTVILPPTVIGHIPNQLSIQCIEMQTSSKEAAWKLPGNAVIPGCRSNNCGGVCIPSGNTQELTLLRSSELEASEVGSQLAHDIRHGGEVGFTSQSRWLELYVYLRHFARAKEKLYMCGSLASPYAIGWLDSLATNSLIHCLIIGAIQTSSTTSIVALVMLISTYTIKHSSTVSTALFYAIGPLYVLTLIYNLNLRLYDDVGASDTGTGGSLMCPSLMRPPLTHPSFTNPSCTVTPFIPRQMCTAQQRYRQIHLAEAHAQE